MASELSLLNTINEVAYLSGLFNWQMSNASYTTPNGQTTVSFHIVTNAQAPIQQYLSGAINTYNLISNNKSKDPNLGLFNTQITASHIKENISRKYAINRVPFANYDQLVDMGTGTQKISFNVIFANTMYKTAYQNLLQCIFGSQSGVGTLVHPFYGKIKNVLPIDISNEYRYDALNCVVCEIIFQTSDLTHLIPNTTTESQTQTIQKWFIGTQNAITSMQSIVTTLKSIGQNVGVLF